MNTYEQHQPKYRKAIRTFDGGSSSRGMVTLDSMDFGDNFGSDYSTNFLVGSSTSGTTLINNPGSFTTATINGINTITSNTSAGTYLNAADVLKKAKG